jgi:beta-glucosidase
MHTKHFLRVLGLGLALVASSTWALAHSAIEPAPRGDGWWQGRQASFNERVKELGKQSQLIFIGDSITQGWEGAGKSVWEERFAKYKAINLGIGGDRTQHVLYRLENGNLEGLAPKAAVVMIGTNNSNGEDNSVDQIADGVTAIVKKLRQDLPDTQVLLVAIFPRGENPNAQRGKILQVNQILQKLADDPAVHWVDFGHRYVTTKGTIPRDLMPDFLHLSPKAYEVWADAIQPYLKKLIVTSNPLESWAGAWTLTMPGPNGDPIDIPMELKADGDRLKGRVARGPGEWLDIENGQLEGDTVTWLLRRERAGGGEMVYRVKSRMVDGQLRGTTTADVDGNEITLDWSARRSQ